MACRADATISKIGGFSWEPPSPFLGTSSAQAHSGAIFEHHPFAALIASRRAAATLRPTGDGRAAAVLEMISPPLAKRRVREGIKPHQDPHRFTGSHVSSRTWAR